MGPEISTPKISSPACFLIFIPNNPKENRDAIFNVLMVAVRAIPDTRDVAADRSFTNGDISATSAERGMEIRSFMQTLNMLCLSMGIFENFTEPGSLRKYTLQDGGIDLTDGVLGDRIAALCSLDAIRTRQYCLALDAAIQDKLAAKRSGVDVSQDEIKIFDVGCGPFPLYSFYAAMAYPDLVECIAVEKNPRSFAIATAIVRHLALEGSITLIQADALKEDLYVTQVKPDIVITETFNIAGIQEHGINILKNCWKHTDSSCITIPQRVTIHAALTNPTRVETLQDSYVRDQLPLDYLHFETTAWTAQIATYGRGERCEDVIECIGKSI